MNNDASSINRGILDSPIVREFDALIDVRAKDRSTYCHRDLFEAITSYLKFLNNYGLPMRTICLNLDWNYSLSDDFLYSLAVMSEPDWDMELGNQEYGIWVQADGHARELIEKAAPNVKILDASQVPVFGHRISIPHLSMPS